MKKWLVAATVALLFVLFSCSNQLMPDVQDLSAETSTPASIQIDPQTNTAVFIEADGSRTMVRTQEESGEVSCAVISDYHIFEDGTGPNRSSGRNENRYRAVILGKRDDGRPGIWFILSGGKVVCLENDEGTDTSELLGAVEGERSLSRFFGWNYDAADMAVNGDEIVIVGTAYNEKGISWHQYNFGAGTQLGVYWVVSLRNDFHYHISRARVIGLREDSGHGHHGFYSRGKSWFWLFQLFFNDWYSVYLKQADSVDYDSADGSYIVKGVDNDDENAVASLIPGRILSIEKDIAVNSPPVASFEEGDFRLENAGSSAANGVYGEAGVLNGSAYFSQLNGNYKIFVNKYKYTTPYPSGTYWGIGTDETTTDFFTLDYAAFDPGTAEYWLPENGNWYALSGSSPVGTITGIPFTVGSDNGDAAGEQVAVHYLYSDPDGDSESGTEITWFRCDTVDALVTDSTSVEISSGSEIYTIQAEDMQKFLKVRIVPVDSNGNRGDAVVSSAYRRLKSGS